NKSSTTSTAAANVAQRTSNEYRTCMIVSKNHNAKWNRLQELRIGDFLLVAGVLWLRIVAHAATRVTVHARVPSMLICRGASVAWAVPPSRIRPNIRIPKFLDGLAGCACDTMRFNLAVTSRCLGRFRIITTHAYQTKDRVHQVRQFFVH